MTQELVCNYGTRENFLTTFNPSVQLQLCRNSDECLFGKYPTLAKLRTGYGNSSPIMWLLPQLYNLSEFCGCKDKLSGAQIEECASVIANEFFYLKVSELMLFFHRFKSGCYGRFYGSVDPLVITTSLREFIKERNEAIDKHEQEERQAKRSADANRENTITYEEFLKLQQQKEQQK